MTILFTEVPFQKQSDATIVQKQSCEKTYRKMINSRFQQTGLCIASLTLSLRENSTKNWQNKASEYQSPHITEKWLKIKNIIGYLIVFYF